MKKALLFPVLILLLASCNLISDKRVDGDGNFVVANRQVSNFNFIEAHSAIDVVFTTAPEYSVKVETDGNLQEYIEVSNSGDHLKIRIKDNVSISSSKHTIVRVTAPSLRGVEVSGASKFTTTNRIESSVPFSVGLSGACEGDIDIKAPGVDIEASGASSLKIKGESKNVTIGASGSTHIRGLDLLAENVTVDISGASHADTYASVKLDAEASGASEIRYRGQATVNAHTSGASSVNKAE